MSQLFEWAEVSLRSAAVYLVLLLVLRIAGKRYAGQLSPHDFVLMLLIANAVQAAMVGPSVSLASGLIAAATLVLINVVLTRFVIHHRQLGPLVSGVPTLLIHNGHVLYTHLEREGILPEELEAQLRAHGYENADNVKIAIQETDGSISVIGFGPLNERRLPALPSTRERRRALEVKVH